METKNGNIFYQCSTEKNYTVKKLKGKIRNESHKNLKKKLWTISQLQINSIKFKWSALNMSYVYKQIDYIPFIK